MPELPEVETVRRGIEKAIVGATIVDAKVSGKRTVRRQPVRQFEALLSGRRVLGCDRRGKYLLVGLDRGTLVVHLRMSGQLSLHDDANDEVVPHTHARFSLDDGRELRFVDPRTFGELFVTSKEGIALETVLSSLGRDPLVEGVDAAYLGAQFSGRRTTLKAVLLDQQRICGIGNIYGDEICFESKIRPDRKVGSLGMAEIERIVVAIDDVLERAIEDGGSSLKDERYRDLLGELGRFQQRLSVYGRAGMECPRCGSTIERLVVAGRSAHFCANCQH
ncbi:MAG: bifunctional DNA-formamidopyrimidine glycosylase/DNA-(apurinic or apyrimidinic site) lyase [Acidimicrobiales bacterium]